MKLQYMAIPKPHYALIGFFSITAVVIFAAIMLYYQLILSQDVDKQWGKILDGIEKFSYMKPKVGKKDSKVIQSDSFFGNKHLDVSAYNLVALRVILKRNKIITKKLVIGLNCMIILGSFIVWILMLIRLIVCKMEKLFAANKGLFLILAGSYFALCALCGIVMCICIGTKDLDGQKEILQKGLKEVTKQLKKFYQDYPDAKINPDNSSRKYDLNDGDIVQLSPPTWFLILMECLQAMGVSISEISSEMDTSGSGEVTLPIISLAKKRHSESKSLVQINGMEYSSEWLRDLHFCPNYSLTQITEGCLLILLCMILVVAMGSLCSCYGLHEFSESGEVVSPIRRTRTVQIHSLADVIGSNEQVIQNLDNPLEDNTGQLVTSGSEPQPKHSRTRPSSRILSST